MTPALFMIQNQYQQAMGLAQQAAMAEMMGNPAAALQGFDQAIGLAGNAIGMAPQYGLAASDQEYFGFAWCSFQGARLKAAFGMMQVAMQYLAQAEQALRQAIGINPGFFGYYSGLGTVVLAQGNAAMAIQCFYSAVQRNPMDTFSQWMLSALYSSQGNTASAQHYYNVASEQMPSLPAPQSVSHGTTVKSGHASQKDWFELINNGMKLASGILGALSDKGQEGAQPSWNSGQFGFPQ